jgi:hypothetical protein
MLSKFLPIRPYNSYARALPSSTSFSSSFRFTREDYSIFFSRRELLHTSLILPLHKSNAS